jgi:hypothetical protein
VGEIQAAASDVRSYLAKEIKKLISIREFNDALPGHLRSGFRPKREALADLFDVRQEKWIVGFASPISA